MDENVTISNLQRNYFICMYWSDLERKHSIPTPKIRVSILNVRSLRCLFLVRLGPFQTVKMMKFIIKSNQIKLAINTNKYIFDFDVTNFSNENPSKEFFSLLCFLRIDFFFCEIEIVRDWLSNICDLHWSLHKIYIFWLYIVVHIFQMKQSKIQIV